MLPVVSHSCTFFPKVMIFVTFQSWSIQAGEFFHSAQSIAAAQNQEFKAHILGEGSIDSPLLLEQVLLSGLTYIWLYKYVFVFLGGIFSLTSYVNIN